MALMAGPLGATLRWHPCDRTYVGRARDPEFSSLSLVIFRLLVVFVGCVAGVRVCVSVLGVLRTETSQ